MKGKIKMHMDWVRYIQCSTLPDPKNERDMNAYLSLLSATPVIKENSVSLELLHEQIPTLESLCTELEVYLSETIDERNAKEEGRAIPHLLSLRKLLMEKWDSLSNHILQHIDQFPREPNENFQMTISLPNHSFGIWANLTRNPRFKMIEFNEINISASLPKPLVLANAAIRVLFQTSPTAAFPFEAQSEGIHLSVVGGVMHLDLLELPELPKQLDSWTIRQLLSPTGQLKKLSYPFKKLEAEAAEEEAESPTSAWPTQVIFTLPRGLRIGQRATVCYWAEDFKCWANDEIRDIEIDPDNGIVKFRSIHFKPTAVVQPTYGEFPLNDWSLLSKNSNEAILTLNGNITTIQVEIRDGHCRLMPMDDLEWNFESWFTPSLLLRRLSHIGIHFRGPSSMKEVDFDMIMKNPQAEEHVLSGLSMCCPAFSFQRQPNSRHLASSKIAVNFRSFETAVEAAATGDEAPWSTLIYDANYKVGEEVHKIAFVAQTTVEQPDVTNETRFNTEEGSKIYASLHQLLRAQLKHPFSTAKIEAASPLFVETVGQLLSATRVLCFS
ncbi:hypothetical protein BJ742DRAFT_792944 [Cladochytrium replicatum]|nr:hypothetical protein BJ742DRAFT_792944 [Cladochytrium replicatum]